MALIERLQGSVSPRLPVHQFYASLVELSAGETTKADIVSFYALTAEDESDLDWLIAKFQASANKREFLERIHGIFMLASIEYPGFTTATQLVGIIDRIG